MPGIIAFQRRWSVGSDDLFAPASFLVVFHFIWLIVLSISLDLCVERSIIAEQPFGNQSNTTIIDESIHIENVSNQNTILSTEESGNLVSNLCKINIFQLHVAFLILWSLALVVEVAIICVSLRGAILEDDQRWPAEYLLYVKLVLWIVEITLTICCVIWTSKNYISCSISSTTKRVIIGLVISNSVIFCTALMTIWCSFDVAGRYWVRLKKYKNSKNAKSKCQSSGSEFSIQPTHILANSSNLGTSEVPPLLVHEPASEKFSRVNQRGNQTRSWKHRKVRLAYQNSWDTRCQHIFCCVKISKNRKAENSFSDIARVLSEFFRDLDVVPGDVVVGLVLLRQRQQLLRLRVVHQPTNSVYKFLSGVCVTPNTPFLLPSTSTYHQESSTSTTHNTIPRSNGESNLCNSNVGNDTQTVSEAYRYMHYAMGIYGWPMYLRQNTGIATCRLCSSLSCCKVGHNPSSISEVDNGVYPAVNDDNCCSCNYAAYSQIMRQIDPGNTKLIYVTYHVDVGETPFLIGVDYTMRSIVLSIRGTLSLADILTDLNAEGEPLPIRPVNEEWMGHKGMVDAAQYIYRKLKEEHLLTRAFNSDKERGTQSFDLICVGHSLGAGTATILAIMLRQEFPRTRCFAYSPPGGTLSQSAVEYSKEFVTSIVVGKDVVPRIGLHQMETLRHDLMNALQKSKDPKWKTFLSSMACCVVPSLHELTAEEIEAKLGIESSTDKDDAVTSIIPGTTITPTEYQDQKGEKEKSSVNKEDEISNLSKSKVSQKQDEINIHPLDSTIHLSVHQKLLPPGRIIHIVRHYQKSRTKKKIVPTFKAIWAANTSFDEVLISNKMVQDHMPDTVLDVLGKLLEQIKEGSNESAKVDPLQESISNNSNQGNAGIQEGTLKGTFVQTVSKSEKTPVVDLSGHQNDDANNSSFVSTSTQANRL